MSRHPYHPLPTEEPTEPSNPGDCRIQIDNSMSEIKHSKQMYFADCCHSCYTILCYNTFLDWCFACVNAVRRNVCPQRSQSNQDKSRWCLFRSLFCGLIRRILDFFRKKWPATRAEEIEKLQSRLYECKKEIEKQKRLNEDLEAENHHLTHDLQMLRSEKDQLEKDILDLEESLAKEKRNFEEEKKEKEKALTRLSAVAGEKLRVNNPGIADLSDENRPNKLAEKFSELYDNEWTELYEDLENSKQTEEDIIGTLLQILQETYNASNNLAANQRRILENAILHPGNLELKEKMKPPVGILSKITDLQKQTTSLVFENIKSDIMKTNEIITIGMNNIKTKYVDRCIQLCWMMAVQDPPMCLDFGTPVDSEIDKNVYRMYTKQGDRVDFVVWPAVFLHHQGPLVQKGVLQPK